MGLFFFFTVKSSLNPLSCLPVLFFYFPSLFVVRERLYASKYAVLSSILWTPGESPDEPVAPIPWGEAGTLPG